MAIRDKQPTNTTPEYNRLRHKSNQEWDMAGLARQDGDKTAEAKHIARAREYDRLAREELKASPHYDAIAEQDKT